MQQYVKSSANVSGKMNIINLTEEIIALNSSSLAMNWKIGKF